MGRMCASLRPGCRTNLAPLPVVSRHRNASENAKAVPMEMKSFPGGRKPGRSFAWHGDSTRNFEDAFADNVGDAFRSDDRELIAMAGDLSREILGDTRRGETLEIRITLVGDEPIRERIPIGESWEKAREECREARSPNILAARWLYGTFPPMADAGRRPERILETPEPFRAAIGAGSNLLEMFFESARIAPGAILPGAENRNFWRSRNLRPPGTERACRDFSRTALRHWR